MVCPKCAEAADKKLGKKAHCNSPDCDCQHRVPEEE